MCEYYELRMHIFCYLGYNYYHCHHLVIDSIMRFTYNGISSNLFSLLNVNIVQNTFLVLIKKFRLFE